LTDNRQVNAEPLAFPGLTALALLMLAWLAHGAGWRGLVAEGRLNLWLGTAVALMLLWRMRVDTLPGMDVHLIGATTVYLMFGLRLGGLLLALAAAAASLAAGRPLLAIGPEWLLHGLVPLVASAAVITTAERRIPAHPLMFLWGYGFLVSGIAVFAGGLAETLMHAAIGSRPWALLSEEYLPFFLLLGFSEAFVAGALLTLMVVYRPGWVARFDDAVYLRKRS